LSPAAFSSRPVALRELEVQGISSAFFNAANRAQNLRYAGKAGDGIELRGVRHLVEIENGTLPRDRAGRGKQQTGHEFRQDGFAYAVTSHQSGALAPERPVQVVQKQSAVRQDVRKVVQRDQRL